MPFILLPCSDYYFSEANLTKDVFLRQQMDSEGFIPAALIASFRRMQTLLGGAAATETIQTIVQAVQDSDVIEVKDGLKVSWTVFEISCITCTG